MSNLNNLHDDDIVISGISGHYPETENIQELMDNLFNGVDMVTESAPRWNVGAMGVPPRIGKMKNVNKCDAQFFGIVRKNCNSLDPVTRQILERCFEALFDAGINPSDLKGSNTGVFINTCISEAEILLVQSKSQETYGIMGRNRALNANRLSYWLDLKGPSYSTDCTWNGGIQAISQAYYSIKSGICDAAIVGSGSVLVHPNASHQFQQLNFLSPDGSTKPFDADANGYARAEAVSVIVIQKAKDARRSYGSIVHVANEGLCHSKNQFIEPTEENWRNFLEKFYQDCKVDPKEIAYLEAYGSANPLFDAAELNACAEIFTAERPEDEPLLIGSIKSNIGHTEAASNLSSLAKLCISLQTDKIPGNLFFNTPNPLIKNLVNGRLKVVSEATSLQGDYVALNSFGLGGTYGHLLLKKNSHLKAVLPPDHKEQFPRIVLLSARHQDGIESILKKIESAPYDPEYLHLINKSFGQNLSGHMYRGYVTVPPLEPIVRGSEHFSGEKRPVWFIFTGMGSQWATMGRDLMVIPHFEKAINQCHEILLSKKINLKQIIFTDDATIFDNILHCFVGIISIQIALVDCIKQLGIIPDGIIGHSVGETVASYCDGCLTLEQTVLAAYYRGKVSLDTKVIQGSMAAVGKGYQDMKDRLAEGIEIACHNGPDSCTLSGPTELIEPYVAKLKSEGIFAKTVNAGNIPYHSKYIAAMGPQMKEHLRKVIPEPKERSSKWISTSVPERFWNESSTKICSGDYHVNNLLNPVLFEEGCKHIPSNAITIEIAPHGLLQAILRRSLGPNCTNITLTNRNSKNQLNSFLSAIGKLYLLGLQPDINKLYPPVQYPISRGTPFLSPLVTWDHSDTWSNFSDVVEEEASGTKTYRILLDLEVTLSNSYKFDGKTVVPESAFLDIALDAFTTASEQTHNTVEFEDVRFLENVVVDKMKVFTLDILIQSGTGWFEILYGEKVVVNGYIRAAQNEISAEKDQPAAKEFVSSSGSLHEDEVYEELIQNGHDFDALLKSIQSIELTSSSDLSVKLIWKNNVATFLQGLLQIQLLRACEEKESPQKLFKVRKIVLNRANLPKSNSIVEATANFFSGTVRSNIAEIYDTDFVPVSLASPKFANVQIQDIAAPNTMDASMSLEYLQFAGPKVAGRLIGYTGLNNKSKRIIGLGELDESGAIVKRQETLVWNVPESWTSEEAITVPLHYSLAYQGIHILGQIKDYDKVLVTEGYNSIGIASLKIVLDTVDSAAVLTSVRSESDKINLLKLVPKLQPSRVYVTERIDQLTLLVRSVEPDGVTLIISTGSSNTLNAVSKGAGKFSKIIEMSEETFDSCGKFLNTITLLNSVSLYNGTKLTKHEDEKQTLKNLLEAGIKSGVVTPISTSVTKSVNKEVTVSVKNKLNEKVARKFICADDKAYLILGGDPYSWLTIADWLIHRRAKYIIVVHQHTILTRNQQRKLLKLQEKCNIIVKTAENFNPQLIEHIFSVSRFPIALTILLHTESSFTQDSLKVLAKKAESLVSIVNPSTNLSAISGQERAGKSTITVQWNSPLGGKIRGFLRVFDDILSNFRESALIRVDEEIYDDEVNKVDVLNHILPSKVEDIVQYVKDLPEETKLTELETSALPFDQVREVLPLFLIPGLTQKSHLEKSCQGLLYPTFLIELPSLTIPNLRQFVATVIPKMKKITNGPFVILGDGWGGILALEIASVLEDMGEKTQVILIGGSPAEVLVPLKNIWGSVKEFEIGFLSKLLNVDPKLLTKHDNWEDKLHAALGLSDCGYNESLRVGLKSIKNKVEAIWNFEHEPLQANILCVYSPHIKRIDLIGLSKREMIFSTLDASESLDTNTINIINDIVQLKKISRERRMT